MDCIGYRFPFGWNCFRYVHYLLSGVGHLLCACVTAQPVISQWCSLFVCFQKVGSSRNESGGLDKLGHLHNDHSTQAL